MYRTAAWGQDARTRRKPTPTITDCRPPRFSWARAEHRSADFTLAYNYSLPGGATPPGCPVQAQGSGNNGSVIGYTYSDSVKPSYSNSALFVYDSVNRLACAQATGNSTYNLAFSYTQDGSTGQYGNMTCSLNSSTNGPCAQYTFNGANQISGYTYDAAGDMISGGGHTYQYDAEGRLASVDGGTTESYIYNAVGQQVRLVSSSYTWDHLYDSAGQWMGRWSNNAWAASGVFHLAGRPFAIYIDQTYFIHVNNLGSTVMTTTPQGVVDGDTQMYPWGQDWLGGTPEWHFAAFQYGDSATGLYPTLNRQYANGEGRWLTPDPGGEKVVHLDDPQTWNMYAYVGNNPTTDTDPTGLECDNSNAQNTCNAHVPSGRDDKKTIMVKVNVIVDKEAHGGKGLTAAEKGKLEGTLLAGARKSFGKSNIALQTTYSEGTLDENLRVTGGVKGSLNLFVSDALPFGMNPAASDKLGGLYTSAINVRTADASDLNDELSHQFLGDTDWGPSAFGAVGAELRNTAGDISTRCIFYFRISGLVKAPTGMGHKSFPNNYIQSLMFVCISSQTEATHALESRALIWSTRSLLGAVVATDLLVGSRLVSVFWRRGLNGLRRYIAFLPIERDMFRPRSCEELVTEALRGYETFALISALLVTLSYLAFRLWRKYGRVTVVE